MTERLYIPDLCASRTTVFMVLVVQLLVLVYALASSSLPAFDWTLLASTSLFVHWVVLLSAIFLCGLRTTLLRFPLVPATAAVFTLVGVVTVLSCLAALWLWPWPPLEQVEPAWWILRNLLVALVMTGLVLRYLHLRQQLRRQEQLELHARIDALRARIRPHFLFNTLNSIASLIELRPEAAEQAVEDLSELFRASLQEGQRETTVGDELRLCELYLQIERLRLGERLQVCWQVAPKLRDKPMPSLLLQPLVENAVYHGVAQLPRGGEVRVDLQQVGDDLVARVENPVPSRPARSSGHRIAQNNIQQRLTALFGKRGRFERIQQQDRYVVELSYPAGAVL